MEILAVIEFLAGEPEPKAILPLFVAFPEAQVGQERRHTLLPGRKLSPAKILLSCAAFLASGGGLQQKSAVFYGVSCRVRRARPDQAAIRTSATLTR